MKAKQLKVKLIKNGKEKVNLSFPVHTVTYLSTIIPPTVKPKLVESGIDLDSLREQIINSDFQQQEIFSVEDHEKKIKVWLD